MSHIAWSCKELGIHGMVMICADQMLPTGTDIGLRHAVHPNDVDEDPQLLVGVIAEMSRFMGRLNAPAQPASRACAFGGGPMSQADLCRLTGAIPDSESTHQEQ